MISDTWKFRAACFSADTDAFFPDKGDNADAALAICNRCPVTVECLNVALDGGIKYGVWGGTTPNQRQGRYRGEWVVRDAS